MCTHVCKCKNDTYRNFQESVEEGIEESREGVEFKYNIFDKL
jgi:hypothetical protein